MKSFSVVFAMVLTCLASLEAQDTVQVKAGWNIIGSVKAGAVPDVLTTIPESLVAGSFWGYRPGSGYVPTDTLAAGFGYWVKAKSDGVIVFKNAPTVDSCRSRAFIYEGKLYHTVKVGEQCWMAENLGVGEMVTGVTEQTNNAVQEKYCYNDSLVNCDLYGGLYEWNEAMQYSTIPGARGICPPGWHIPTLAEFQTLYDAVGGDGNALKTLGQGTGGGAATNTSGFSALLAGHRVDLGNFGSLGLIGYFWGSTENDAATAGYLTPFYYDNSINLYYTSKNLGFSVRCLWD